MFDLKELTLYQLMSPKRQEVIMKALVRWRVTEWSYTSPGISTNVWNVLEN